MGPPSSHGGTRVIGSCTTGSSSLSDTRSPASSGGGSRGPLSRRASSFSSLEIRDEDEDEDGIDAGEEADDVIDDEEDDDYTPARTRGRSKEVREITSVFPSGIKPQQVKDK